ncbi:MAG: hypothetical protein LBS01_01280 [Prevotellaceae bacterium]|jgi:hypothetical protein|nr:hypothetical protein [Prevotellaceae bacterium]
MKKKYLILFSALLTLTCSIEAQVGIGKIAPAGVANHDSIPYTDPQGLLHLQGKSYVNDSTVRNMGFVIPKVDAVTTVTTPQGGEPVMGTLVFTVNDSIDSKQDLSIPGALRVRLKDGWSAELVEMSSISDFFNYDVYGGLNVRTRKVSAGYRYSLVIGYEDEAVYTAGENANGKTGLGGISGNTNTFRMALAHQVIDISAGYQHALAASRDGEVWSWGDGANYRTGQTGTTVFTFPVRVKNLTLAANDTVIRCEAGYDNSLLLTKLGKVYSFGANRNGVNGTGSGSGDTTTPTQINLGSNVIKDIALSSLSGAAINQDGRIYTWGNQQHGRLGNGASTSSIIAPAMIIIPNNTPVKQVAMGTNHGLAVSEDGKHLYGWGAAQGWGGSVGATESIQVHPIEITGFLVSGGFDPATDSIVSIAATRFTSSGTPSGSTTTGGSIVITNKNVYAAGSNTSPDRLGLGYFPKSTIVMYSPTPASGVRGTVTQGFLPIYNKAIMPGVLFDQVSIGVDHSLLKQTLVQEDLGDGTYRESGSYGYGMGVVSQNQLGAVSTGFSKFPIPSFIKK